MIKRGQSINHRNHRSGRPLTIPARESWWWTTTLSCGTFYPGFCSDIDTRSPRLQTARKLSPRSGRPPAIWWSPIFTCR